MYLGLKSAYLILVRSSGWNKGIHRIESDRCQDGKKVLYKTCLFVSDDTSYINILLFVLHAGFATWCYLVV